jgi:hypothetical protein
LRHVLGEFVRMARRDPTSSVAPVWKGARES